MKTVYGKLTTMIVLLMAALLLFLPMRSGLEDHLYASPRSIRMNRGDSYDITYTLDADYAQRVTYASVNEAVAQVDQRGHVTAVAPGTTDIHLSAEGGARTSVRVEVVGTPTTQLTLNTDSITMEKGQVTGLRVTFNNGADDTRIEWRSRDASIAQVDSIGRVTALRGGRTVVYALAPNGLSAGANVFVHVSGNAVHITPEELTVGTGASLSMGCYYLPDDTTDEVAYWLSNDESILTVDADGTIHAVGVGRAVLSVYTKEGLSGSTFVNVEQAAEEFDVSPSAVTVERGDTLQIEPRFFNAEGEVDGSFRRHYISWSSSDPSVATVDDGMVTALKSGTTRITASADGMTAVCTLRVQVLVHEITLEESEVYMLREHTVTPIQLHPTLYPEDPDDPTITYSTNNDMVANVDQNGLVTMTGGYGTAIITARAASGAEARFTVNVVTEMPDPNATPTATPEPSEDVGDSGDEGGFSFDDIGNGVQGRRSTDDLGDEGDASAPQGGGENSGGAQDGGSGGDFSFDDIGNGVEAPVSIDENGQTSVNDTGDDPGTSSDTSAPQSSSSADDAPDASNLFEF